MQKYPIGLQDFEKIREGQFLYIDKTQYIEELLKRDGYYFLSRPRRFGKSLFINTLDSLFQGKKELFEGLQIANKWDFSKTNPVIKISFAAISHKEKGLYKAINDRLNEISKLNGLEIEEDSISAKFKLLIEGLYAKFGHVVVLIDEYDKPIIDFLGEDTKQAIENRNIMKSFYSILKDSDAFLKLVFITGVSKFARVSIFSDLNNLQDITIDYRFAGVCGITQDELNNSFQEELKEFDKEKIKQWYNGYTWDLKTSVYNPFSILNFFVKKKFQNFWFESGTPTFLVNLCKKSHFYDFENVTTSLTYLNSYDIEKLQILPLMFQTGYLTFKNEEDDLYILDYPNQEVKKSYLEALANSYIDKEGEQSVSIAVNIRNALRECNIDKFQSQINSLFKSIPYTLWQKENEHFYHAILHLTFKLLGFYVESEVQTADGRLDALVKVNQYIYCFEFKLDESAEFALQQIKDKGYLEPYQNQGKECIAIGVNFSKELKKVEGIKWEKLYSITN